VSPFLEAGRVDATVYDHASIPATVNGVLGLGTSNLLTGRDRWAQRFDQNLTLASARPAANVFQADAPNVPSLDVVAPAIAAVAGVRRALGTLIQQRAQAPLSSFSSHQRRLLELANHLHYRLPQPPQG
jgi:hypothetical protein